MAMLALAAVAGGLVLAGACVAAGLRLRSFVSFLLTVYLVALATVVASTELLSLGRLVGASAYGLCTAGVAAVSVAWWIAVGKPRLPLPRVALRSEARTHPLLAALVACIVVAGVYELFVVSTTPPNNGDSLTYHLTRAAAWFQHEGIHRIPGPEKAAENDYPPNAEIQILFTFAFLRSDVLAAAPQLLALVVSTLAVYGIARRLDFAPAGALLGALLVPTLAQPALQSMTTQNDLAAGSLVAVAAHFLHRRDRADPWLAGLALGLALGTKLTVIFALPVLALLAVASIRGRALVAAGAAAVLGFACFGSAAYVRNVVDAGTPLGALEGDPGEQRPEVTPVGTVSTVARYVYGLADVAGYPLDYRDLRVPTALARKAFTTLGIPANPPESTGYPFGFAINVRAHEDIAFFGPLGIVLLAIATGFLAAWIRRRAGPERAVHAAALPLYLCALAVAYRYSGQGRFLITPVLLTVPLAAVVYRRRAIAAAVAAVGVLSLVFVLAHDELKPTGLRGTAPIWSLSRSEAQGVGAAASVSYLVERLEARVPEDATLGTVTGEHDTDYVLYGPRLTRALVPLSASSLAEAGRLRLRWVYVGRLAPRPPLQPGWAEERLSDAGSLFAREPGPSS